jgi:hypothetical protein
MALTLDGTTGISTTGNIVGNNIIANTLSAGTFSPTSLSASGNITGGNILTAGVVSATGNITGAYILGNGSQLTGVDATQIVNGTSNAKVVSSGGNIAVGIGGTANVAVFATTGLFVTGVMSSTGNGIHGNILTGGLISATSTITSAANIVGGNLTTAGIVTATGNIQGGNLRTAGLITATGNITGNYIIGNGSQLTGLPAGYANSDAAAYLASGTVSTNILTTAAISATGNVTGGNIRTAGLISATGTITGSQFNGSGAGLTSIPNGALSNSSVTVNGTAISLGGSGTVTANASTLTGTALNATVVASSLTSVGTLGSLAVTGNITSGNVSGTRGAFTNVAGTLETASQTNITAVGTLGSLSVTGNVQAGNLRTAGLISATGAITGAALTGTSLTVSTGNVSCGNLVNTNSNGVGNIGSSTTYYNTVFAKATSAQYADLAELYSAGASYEPGTVVVFGGAYEVEISTTSHANHVAGVISTNPSYLMNAGQQGPHVVAVALQGRVPTRVIGTVRKGDRMVSSLVPGVAQTLDQTQYEPGCILGKALQEHQSVFDEDGNEIPGTIEIVVGRV